MLQISPLEQFIRSLGDLLETEAFESPHFQPFTTPGPASTISRLFTPSSIPISSIDVNMFPSPESPVYGHEVYIGKELLAAEHESDIFQEQHTHCGESANLDYDAVRSQYGILLDSNPAMRSSEIQPANRHLCSGSSVEGCSYSYSTSGSCTLDVEGLDFRPGGFDCTGLHQQDPISYISSLHQSGDVEPEFVNAEIDPREDFRFPSSDEDRFRFQATSHDIQSQFTTYSAPIQGIYISPPEGSSSGNIDLGARQESRCSRDSIESWSD